jgi:hypothetical protein
MSQDTDFQGQGHDAEWFWLCEQCAVTMTIISGRHNTPPTDALERMRSVQMGADGVHLYLHPKE